MGKLKRKQRGLTTSSTKTSASKASNNKQNLISSCVAVCSPPKSVSPCSSRSSTVSLSSCSSSTSSLSSPPSVTSSPSPNWPHSLTQSVLPSSSVSSYVQDEDSGLGSSDLSSAYSPHKVARFNQTGKPSATHLSPLTALPAHNDMLNLKTPFSKRSSPSAISPSGSGQPHSHPNPNHPHHQLHHSTSHHAHHHNQYLPPIQVTGYPPEVSVLSATSVSPQQCYPNSIPNGPVSSLRQQRTSSPNARNSSGSNNLLVPSLRKSSSSSSVNNQNAQQNANSKSPSSYSSRSKNGKYELKILSQPEEQHRARYLTEGSRGAIKDKSGHGYPVVKLCGYTRQPVKISCFIGHDKYIGTPHLFYQASKIAGKNSTTCYLKKVDGTSMITMEASPANNMEVNVDCIGILKERNVDVEQKLNKFQRLGHASEVEAQSVANIKRSTRCRLVFRAELPENGEILQCVSAPILCTQPLGTPEINKKSLTQCDINGGTELFIIGKNFLKDAKVIFRNEKWIKIVEPNREYLKSTHLICVIPAYDVPVQPSPTAHSPPQQKANHRHRNGKSSVSTSGHDQQVIEVNLMVKSGGKCSDPHKFYYTVGGPSPVLDRMTSASTDHPSESVSPFDHLDSTKTMMDSLIEAGKHPNDATQFIAQYHHQQHQQQLDKELVRAVAAAVQGAAPTLQGSTTDPNSLSQQIANVAADMSPMNSALVAALSPESRESVGSTASSKAACEASVLAAAVMAATNEVQVLSANNQLTATSLQQTLSNAAAVATTTESIINEQLHSQSPGVDSSQPALTASPDPATMAAVAAQSTLYAHALLTAADRSNTHGSMIPFLTNPDKANALAQQAAANAVKQESLTESDLIGVPGSQPVSVSPQVHQAMQSIQQMQAMAPQTAFLNSTLMNSSANQVVVSPEVNENKAFLSNYSTNLVSSNTAPTIESSGPPMHSLLQCSQQDMNMLQDQLKQQSELVNQQLQHQHQQQQQQQQQAQLNAVLNSSQVLLPYNTNQSVMMRNPATLSRITSMETNPMSYASLNHPGPLDPMMLPKVDTLTINDKVPLPQLTLNDINNQLSMSSTATAPTNMSLIQMGNVIAEKPVLYTAADVASLASTNQMHHHVDTVALVNGTLMSVVSADKSANAASNLSNAVAVANAASSLIQASASPAGASVIMTPTSYNLATAESTKCSSNMIDPASYGRAESSSLVNLPPNDYLSPTGLVSDLKSAITPTMMGPLSVAQSVSPVAAQQAAVEAVANAIAQQQQDKVNANIESFIQNMTNEPQPSAADLTAVNAMLTSSLTVPSQPMPTYLNTSLIADCTVSSGQQLLNTGMLSGQPEQSQQNPTTGVIISGASSNIPGRNATVMMDTLPPAVNTQNGQILTRTHLSENTHPVCTPTTALGHTLVESVSMRGQGGPIQFTDNVEMSIAPSMASANQLLAVNNQTSAPQAVGISLAGPVHQYLPSQSMITSDQSNANTTGNTILEVKDATVEQTVGTVSTAPMTTSTVLANHQLVTVQQQQQQQQQQSANMHAMTSMMDPDLLNFINNANLNATFE